MDIRHKDTKMGANSGEECVATIRVKPSNARSKYWDDYVSIGSILEKFQVLSNTIFNIGNFNSMGKENLINFQKPKSHK